MLVLEADPSSWSYWTFFLYGFALYAAGGFVWSWFRFQSLERAARGGGHAEVVRFNRVLSGFPNAVYAKMLGKRRLEESDQERARTT